MDRQIKLMQTAAQDAVDLDTLIVAVTGLRDHADALDEELERERARWAGAAGEAPPRLHENTSLALTTEAARQIICTARERGASPDDVPALVHAGATFRDRANVLRSELSVVLDLWARAPIEIQNRRLGGRELLETNGPDGTRHFLDDEPLCCGRSLLLLTDAGWILGRYELGAGGEPRFYYSLPGGRDRQVSIPIPRHARLTFARQTRIPVEVDPEDCVF
jgi:hypothetical protein